MRAIGGGAKSQIWTQLKADVLSKPIAVLDITEAGCLGAAMLARAADANEPLTSLAAEWIKTSDVKQPRSEYADWYEGRFELYRRLYPALRQLS